METGHQRVLNGWTQHRWTSDDGSMVCAGTDGTTLATRRNLRAEFRGPITQYKGERLNV
jgi:hypothetical protein